MDFNKWNIFWSLCFGAMAFIIILGNTLSIFILSKRRLRKRPHFLLISLAIADLLVGLFAIPIYMTMVISKQNLVSKLVFDCVDMFTGFSSVFTLAFISLERLNAIARPLQHRQLTLRSYIVAILMPWILSFMVTSTRVLLGFLLITVQQFLIVIITSLSTPLFTSFICYSIISKKQRARIRFRQRHEIRFSKTVLLITGTFVVTWMPFQVLVVVLNKCLSCSRTIFVAVVFIIKLLQFGNSVVNFLIYCCRMPSYRRELFAIFPCCRYRRDQSQVVFPFVENQTTSITLLSFANSQTLHRARHR